jgi:hypothetical protein
MSHGQELDYTDPPANSYPVQNSDAHTASHLDLQLDVIFTCDVTYYIRISYFARHATPSCVMVVGVNIMGLAACWISNEVH